MPVSCLPYYTTSSNHTRSISIPITAQNQRKICKLSLATAKLSLLSFAFPPLPQLTTQNASLYAKASQTPLIFHAAERRHPQLRRPRHIQRIIVVINGHYYSYSHCYYYSLYYCYYFVCALCRTHASHTPYYHYYDVYNGE